MNIATRNNLHRLKQELVDFVSPRYFDRRAKRVSIHQAAPRFLMEKLIDRTVRTMVGSPVSDFARRLAPFRFPDFPSFTSTARLPDIEALVVVTKKDFATLKACIRGIQRGSMNPVGRITVITPSADIELCNEALKHCNSSLPTSVKVVQEESFLTESLAKDLRLAFGDRFGWVLQQLLKLAFVESSTFGGVLVVDGDTVLLTPRIWLGADGAQLLPVSSEYNHPYYTFLQELGLGDAQPETTHVTHHMLMQPKLLKSFLANRGFQSVEELGRYLAKKTFKDSHAPFSVDYELYAQSLLTLVPEKARLSKFGNFGCPTAPESTCIEIQQLADSISSSGRYFSVSFHTHLRG